MRVLPLTLCAVVIAFATSCATTTDTKTLQPSFACAGDMREPKAWYVGPYEGFDNNLSGYDLARDIYCAEKFKSTLYPKGYVTIYGSSSLKEDMAEVEPYQSSGRTLSAKEIETEYKTTYSQVRAFARFWTENYGKTYPIMTGAGPGLMEAGSRGAMEGGGPSVGYTTYYGNPEPGSLDGQTSIPAFARYKKGAETEVITSTGLIFSSVAVRETSMILHSAAIVLAPGGAGSEWEIFQILEMLKSKQLRPVPVYFVGADYHWYSLKARIKSMKQRGTVKPEHLNNLTFVKCPEELMFKLATDLKLPTDQLTSKTCGKPSAYEVQALMELN